MPRVQIALGTVPILSWDVRGQVAIGRSESCDLVLPLPEIAERHVVLAATDQGLELFVEGEETVLVNDAPAVSGVLKPTDVLRLGPYSLRIATPRQAIAHESATRSDEHALGERPRRIVVQSGPDAGKTMFLDRATVLVGRAPECDLVLSDKSVSSRHASLELAGNALRVRDLDSRNGTFVADERIESVLMCAGGEIRLGRTLLRLLGLEDPPPPSPDREPGLLEMTGSSAAMQAVYRAVRVAASSTLPVLVTGETGTGKELAARAVHVLGQHGQCPLVPINTAAIPRDLVESELFGHVRGAFTGAHADQKGAFERANGGTLFLDEIAELPLEIQPKLLRAVESGEVTPLGRSAPVRCRVRVVAATNRDLEHAVREGRFREDLYYRLAVLSIRMPPLRDRAGDVRELVHRFISAADHETGVPGASRATVEPRALAELEAHDWPGNVRELRNLVHRAVVLVEGGKITRDVVMELLKEPPRRLPPGESRRLLDIERDAILNCLRDVGGNKRAAARRLGIALSTLYEKLRRFGEEGSRQEIGS